MRTYNEMMQLIMDKAMNDERIRAVLMNGSRANSNAVHDEYSDFDICYVVTDIREFTKDKNWITYFGDILIVQYPVDWYSHPYDYTGKGNFTYLIQFQDGNRIDLSLIDITHVEEESFNVEPRMVLLNKDNLKELIPVRGEEAFYIKKPSEMEYYNTCNEFRWLSIYITKGLSRREIYYAKYAYDCLVMEMFVKMLNWKIAIDHDFMVTTGDHSKYLKRFLSPKEMDRFQDIFPNGDYEDIWNRLFIMYDYFAETAEYVGGKLGYFFDKDETIRVRDFLKRRRTDEKA
ncbi:MAG TPA: aminoglycoside 6-adenylyltransferase [Lachnospiraceae bacterium]|nr:aminoglycoside 6-adenylyltransferase [Lachnospiraceae bacterium]